MKRIFFIMRLIASTGITLSVAMCLFAGLMHLLNLGYPESMLVNAYYVTAISIAVEMIVRLAKILKLYD